MNIKKIINIAPVLMFLFLCLLVFCLALIESNSRMIIVKQKIPIKIVLSKNIDDNIISELKDAVGYINYSMKKEMFSFSQGNNELKVISYNDLEDLEYDYKQEQTKAFVVFKPYSLIIKNNFKELGLKKILLAHELLHSLGFKHQPEKFDSLLNEGGILVKKMDLDLNYAKSLQKKLPEYDVELINQYY